MRSALIRYWYASSISVENEVIRASETDLIVPIPGGTSRVRGLGVVEVRRDTQSILKIITFIAFGTISIFSMSFALISNWNTDFIVVEKPLI